MRMDDIKKMIRFWTFFGKFFSEKKVTWKLTIQFKSFSRKKHNMIQEIMDLVYILNWVIILLKIIL